MSSISRKRANPKGRNGEDERSIQLDRNGVVDGSLATAINHVSSLPMKSQKRSSVWEHYERPTRDLVTCKLCPQKLKYNIDGTTSNMKKHLKSKHGISFPSVNRKQNVDVCSSSSERRDKEELHHNSKTKRKAVSRTSVAKKKRVRTNFTSNRVDKMFAFWMIRQLRPFGIVDDEEFEEFLRLLNPGYRVPSLPTMLSGLFNDLKTRSHLKVSQILQGFLASGRKLNVIVQIVSPKIHSTPYLTIMVSLLENDFSLIHPIIGVKDLGSITSAIVPSENLTNEQRMELCLTEAFRDFNISLSDIGALLVGEGYDMVERSPSLSSHLKFRCAAAELLSCFHYAFETIRPLLRKCRELVDFFKYNSNHSRRIGDIQLLHSRPLLRLVQDDPLNCDGTYNMIHSIIELEPELYKFVESSSDQVGFDELSPSEWEILRGLEAVLRPIVGLTSLLIGVETSNTLSLVLPFICFVLKSLDDTTIVIPSHSPRIENTIKNISLMPQEVRQIRLRLQNEIKNRWYSALSTDSSHMIACALDPRFKHLEFLPSEVDTEKVWEILHNIVSCDTLAEGMEENVSQQKKGKCKDDEFTNALSSRSGFFNNESENSKDVNIASIVQSYRKLPSVGKGVDPISWWKLNSRSFPKLAEIAKGYLSIPATATFVDKACAKLHNALSENEMAQQDIVSILFTHFNIEYL